MKNLLFKLYLGCIKFILKFTTTNENSYVVLNGSGRSGSNGYIFYKYLKNNHPDLNVTIIDPWPTSHINWKMWLKIGQAKYIFTTHQPFKIKRKQICTCFWHGIPLKRMGFMALNDNYANDINNMKIWQKNADRVITSSCLYESLMSACVAIEGSKYQKLGFPRIDALYNPAISKTKLLKDLFKITDEDAKIGVYMPTFRFELNDKDVMQQINNGNFFAFKDFDIKILNDNLAKLKQFLIIKLHPYEMKAFDAKNFNYSNIIFLDNTYLYQNELDLYEILGLTDFLITDYSSIYFDYLHLNKPIIFITNYLKNYEEVRGLLLDPYQKVVPGDTVNNEQELLFSLTNLESDKFEKKRKYWLSLSYSIDLDDNCRRNFAALKN